MLAQTLEIKVALLGNVSEGKTTVLNALFRDKFGEVAMKRTTVGANFFRAHLKEPEADTSSVKSSDDTSTEEDSLTDSPLNGRDWLKVADNATSAESILKEISADNVRLREIESDTVHESF
jgi:GTPase SAR1 family protein